jgi:glycosyltransferase involved in cell wall biosynthesis
MTSATIDGISIVIPAYNEENGLRHTVEALIEVMNSSELAYEIIVIDDGSKDKTAEVAQSIPGIHFLQNRVNIGYGATLKRGIRAAAHEMIAITDADGTYPNERIPGLAGMLTEDVDMVVGWRKGSKVKIPLMRRPVKWVIKRFAESLAGYAIPDINSGLRIFRKQTVVDNENVLPQGFSFTATITLLIASGGGNIVYEPIDYHARTGDSKFHPIKDTWGMISLIVRSVLLFDPLRVFVPVALACFMVAVGVFIASLLWLPGLWDATIIIFITTGFHFLGMGLLADLINRRR